VWVVVGPELVTGALVISRVIGNTQFIEKSWPLKTPKSPIWAKWCTRRVRESGTTELRSLLHGHGVDLIAADFHFDAVRRPQIVSLHDGAAHHDVSGEVLELQGIKDGAAAGINDHGMRGLESIFGRKLRDIIDISKLALTERRFQRECPIGFAFGRRTGQADN
jgi:hypothetical protein